MRLHRATFTALIITLLLTLTAHADSSFRPAILFNSDVVQDNAFNQQLLEGVQTYAERKGIDYAYKASANPRQYHRYLDTLIRGGRNPILAPGAATARIVRAAAEAHPDTTFITIDYSLDLPNVRSILFREREAAYLAGVLAAYRTESQVLGFVGGMKIPAIEDFREGFFAGAHSVNPVIQTRTLYLSDNSARPFDDADAGYQAGRKLLADQADIVFSAAGSSGEGTLRALAEAGALGIGVDSNQNDVAPGHVLTSVLKKLDRAVYVALVSERWGLWRNRVKHLGLAQDGVGLAMDEHNAPLITRAMHDAVDQVRNDILAGRLIVSDSDGSAIATERRPLSIRVLLPDTPQWPYITNAPQTGGADRPGLVIDALNLASQELGVPFHYERQPLRRGIYSLGRNEADALLVKSISPELDNIAVYPVEDGRPDPSRALMHWDLAVYRRADSPTGVDYRLMPIAVPLGTRIAEDLARKGVDLSRNDNLRSRLGMLERARVNTVVADPLHADYLIGRSPRLRNTIVKTADAIGEEASYLLLSRDFYRTYPRFSEELWNQLSQVRESVALWDQADRYFEGPGVETGNNGVEKTKVDEAKADNRPPGAAWTQ
ncbi:BMP family ABC transporter substrate-binding protein [Marinobacter sp. JSM 1782161]|uniref:BMP family ABC transporter substrate-binding protein n=1 Tax=Marinobacter sp. JSM 1782161 TaxID=2685906 RepID=UPI001402D5C2|nr:BMP family ABC transporter substrate-binding protein [Marinobacter sp. JSM 1782161]